MKAITHIITASLMAFTAWSTVYADQTYFTLSNTNIPSKISGYSGTLTRLNVGEFSYEEPLSLPSGDYGSEETRLRHSHAGITDVSWQENHDKPCDIKATPRALNRASVKKQPSPKSKNICTGRAGNKKVVSLPAGQYVRGISVCTTNKKQSRKNRLKGIALYAATLSTSPPLVRSINAAAEKAQHTNCRKWHQYVGCPNGYIATGLQIYSQDDSFRGLGLKCRKVELSPSPFFSTE